MPSEINYPHYPQFCGCFEGSLFGAKTHPIGMFAGSAGSTLYPHVCRGYIIPVYIKGGRTARNYPLESQISESAESFYPILDCPQNTRIFQYLHKRRII